jgi:hypothetical protein
VHGTPPPFTEKKITPDTSPRSEEKKSETTKPETGPRIQEARRGSRKLKIPNIEKQVPLSKGQLKALEDGNLLESDLKEGQLQKYKKFERKVTERLERTSPRMSPRQEASARPPSPTSVRKVRGETLEVSRGSEEQGPLTPRDKSSPRIKLDHVKPRGETPRVIPKQMRISMAELNEPLDLDARLKKKIDLQRKKIDGLKQQLKAEEGQLSLLQQKREALLAKAKETRDTNSSADADELVYKFSHQRRQQ